MALRRLSLLLLLCAACGGEAAIDLVVDGDLEPGVDFDEVRVSMSEGGAQVWAERYEVEPDDGLPLSFRVARPSGADRVVELRVSAHLGSRRQVEAVRQTSLTPGETLRVCLWERCLGSEEPSCLEGSCEAPSDGDADADAEGPADADEDADTDADETDAEADEVLLCSDECLIAGDGVCADGGDDSVLAFCEYGTDCSDCGPRRPDDCVPQCHVRRCGPDHCGGICSPGCGPGEACAFGGACVTWVEVHPDDPFIMGSPAGELGRGGSVERQREVTLTRGFAIPTLEVTQAWFTSLVGVNPSTFTDCGLDCPVDSVSWPAAALFCNTLSIGEGLPYCYECSGTTPTTFRCELAASLASPYECGGYRLPTEAEFEYAARAGTTTATYNGDLVEGATECESPNPTLDSIAWFCGNAPESTPGRGGQLEPNALGLYDMLGNMFEYTHDWYETWDASPVVDPWGPPDGTTRSFRGGSSMSKAWETRAAGRGNIDPTTRGLNIGFRPVRTIE